MAHKTFPCLYLCWKLTAVELCWNGTFSKFLETAYGLVIIIKRQVCIDPSVLAIPMNLPPQSSPEKLGSPRSRWYLWCPWLQLIRIHLFLVPLCPCLLKISVRWGWQCIRKILDQAVAAVHQYPETKCTVFDLHYWIQKQAPDEEWRYRPLRVFVTPRTKTEFPQRFLPKLEVTMVNMRC